MHWSLEKYLIADDCQLRLTLTGTVSSTEEITKVLRRRFLTGELSGCDFINKISLTECIGRMANIRRHADYNIPPGTRYVFKRKQHIFSVPLDFVSILGSTATVFFISKKKYKGTINQTYGYICITEAVKRLYPEVKQVYLRELLMLPVGTSKKSDLVLVISPGFEVPTDRLEHALNKVFSNLKLNRKHQRDLRKCRIVTDPCPARAFCPAMRECDEGESDKAEIVSDSGSSDAPGTCTDRNVPGMGEHS